MTFHIIINVLSFILPLVPVCACIVKQRGGRFPSISNACVGGASERDEETLVAGVGSRTGYCVRSNAVHVHVDYGGILVLPAFAAPVSIYSAILR